MKKVKSLDSKLFTVIDTKSLSNKDSFMGGKKKTKSSATGWTCKDSKSGHDSGPWEPKSVIGDGGLGR